MMRVLPHSLGDDERRVRVNAAKDLDALPLAGDEAVLLFGIVRMRAPRFPTLGLEGFGERVLHGFLRRPASLVGGKAEIATGDDLDGLGGFGWGVHGGKVEVILQGRAPGNKTALMPCLAPRMCILDLRAVTGLPAIFGQKKPGPRHARIPGHAR